ncbi:MAG TPA: undecaprenyldiphospho-muramoylpentapeptide beta-N-acetylglucosaminyltransferase [Candidatus Cloacimonadota bacterium]|nr:undecaprenyldiphospho-muramoylpentapeptide beta-N-acetylglucosaminyltransferase [Candidatus Cloacimonadota bacterium]
MRFVLGGGGTGGHIYPLVAIAEELRKGGHEVSFIGNRDSMESRLIPKEGYPFLAINVQKLYRKLTLKHLNFPVLFSKSFFSCMSFLRRIKPDAVICTGGFVSGPIALAAILLKRPLYFWDGNSYPGLTTRLLARYMKGIFVAFRDTERHLNAARTINTWIPLRSDFRTDSVWDAKKYGLSESKQAIFVTGGSQGSKALNEAVDSAINGMLEQGFELIWQTGKTQSEYYLNKYNGQKGVYIFGFSDELPAIMNYAWLAVTRAGAMTIAELQGAKLPAILIPLPTAAENHQYYNALEQERKGVAKLLEQSKLTGESLLECITSMRSSYSVYKEKLESIPLENVAANITNYIIKDISGKE